MLIVSSSPTVTRLISIGLRVTKCSIGRTNSNMGKRTLTIRLVPSLVVLSLVLPEISKLAIYRQLQHSHQATSVPILVLATLDRARSGISNFGTKTSSCLAGPFRLSRVLTEIQTLLQQASHVPRTTGRDRVLGFNPLALVPRHCRTV